MKITPTVLQQPLIGLNVKVADGSNAYGRGIAGRVVDETRNTLVILHKHRKKTIVKNTAVFHFTLSDGTMVEIDGKTIIGRPEERAKRRIRRLW